MSKDNGAFGVFVPVEVNEEKTFWNRIGAAFVNSKGFTLLLDAIPAQARAVVVAEDLAMGDGPFKVFTPVEYEKDGERKTRWTRIGTALGNKKGLTVLFNAYPTNGKAVVVIVEEEKEGEKQDDVIDVF
ncbi:hypothetical protein [Meiothermus ruber]|uniref:hypothetical protein n=1 Tax=Meiothermus ruber TaxID=277 RepID=UPI00034BA6F0|nr:hypothetical protein [Meiothermus ruber]GAO74246.1 putative uncharacterized protein [Meiothermus ruber H328]